MERLSSSFRKIAGCEARTASFGTLSIEVTVLQKLYQDDLDTLQANVVTQQALALQAGGALNNSEGTLSSQQSDLSVQAQSLNNDQGTLLAGNDLAVTLSGALLNTDGTVYAGGNATLDTGVLTNTGTIAAAEDLTINATSVASSGTLAAGLNSDGSLDAFTDDGGALRITTIGNLKASGNNLAAGRLAMQGKTVNLSDSQTSAFDAEITAKGALNTDNANLISRNDINVGSQRLSNTDGTVYAGGNATLDTGVLTNTGTIAAAEDLTIDAASVASSGTLAAGLNQDGSLNAFADDGGALSVTTIGDLSAIGNNLAAGRLTLEGGTIDLSASQTSAYNADITADGALNTGNAKLITRNDINVGSQSLSNTDGTVYAGGNATLNTGALNNTGTLAAADDLTIDAASLTSSGTLAAGLNQVGSLNAFADEGGALSVTSTGDLAAIGNNLAAGHLRLEGDKVDLSDSQTSAYSADLTAQGALNTKRANVVTQEALALQAGGALDNSEGTLSSQQGDLSVQAHRLNNNQGTLLSGDDLAVTLSDTLLNTDGTVYARGSATLDAGALTNTGTIAAVDGLTIDAASVASSGTLAAGLNPDGSLNAFAGNGSALRVTTTGNLKTTGNNLATGRLTLQGETVDLRGSQNSAFDAHIDAKGVLYTGNTNIVAHDDINIEAQSLSNMGGTVYAGGNATLDTGALTNTGTIAAANDLTIDATSVTSSGTLAAGLNQNGTLKAFADGGGALSIATTGGLNSTGSNLAAGRLTLEGANVDLSNSQTSAHSADIIARGGLTTGQANVVTEGELSLQADGALDNTGGVLASKTGSLMIDADGVINTGGLMVAATGLDINANSKNINNTGGEVMAQDDMNLSTHGHILNTGGLVQSNAAVSLSANTLDNRQTSANTQGIVGNDVQVTANTVNNTEGQVLAGRDLTITADSAIINTHGKLNAQRNLTLQDGAPSSDAHPGTRNLIISNTDGVILANNESAPAGTSVNITANALSLDGILESGGDMALDLVGDLSTAAGQQVRTEGVLSLRLHGDPSGNTFTNAGKWEGGRGLAVQADEIHNQSSGELRSQGITMLDTTQTSGGSVTNRGLIDGADTRISSHMVDNVGSGRLYGDRIAIVASILNNRDETAGGQTQAATIAARERMDIGAQHITNREGALIFSGGDMAIGGTLLPNYRAVTDGSANALTLNNNSATIESLGNMALAANTLRNTNEHFTMEEHFVGETNVTLIQPEGWHTRLDKDDLVWVEGDESPEDGWSEAVAGKDFSGYYVYYDGSGAHVIRSWTQYQLTRKEYESRVISSDPGAIIAGGNLSLRGQDLLNDKSRIIVGQTLHGDIANLENREALGEKRVSEEGSARRTNPQEASFSGPDGRGRIHYTRRQWHGSTSYNPPDEMTTISLDVGEVRQNAGVSGSGTHITDKTNVGTLGSTSGGDTDATGSTLSEQALSNTAQEVDQSSVNTSDLSTDTQGVTQASVSAEAADRANSPGNVTSSANAVDTESHGANGASFSANSPGSVTSSANAVDTESHGANGASFSNSPGNVKNSANAVDTESHGANGASFSSTPGNVKNSANAVDTESHGANGASFSNRPGSVTNSANAVNTESHGVNGASFSNSPGSMTNSANTVNTESHGANGSSFSNSPGSMTNSANTVNTESHGANGASFSNSPGSVTSSANAVNTDAHGANGASFSANSPGSVANSANAVKSDAHGATGTSFSAKNASITHQASSPATDTTLLGHASPSQGAQATAGLGTQNGPALLLPNSSLFTVNPGSNARYLVATDPQFADYRQWLSSDYLLSALAIDPAQSQKRVGDGFYEQKLIREQVAALTGYRFLGDYRSDDEQYTALMNAGAAFAHTHQLRPGIALTTAQTAQLTSDIVWLVTQTVQLPDGTTTTALMPKIYLAPRQGDLAANGELLGGNTGTLISARDVDLTLSGDLSNSGTIAGRKMVDITAQNLNNSGHIQGDLTLINARQDINLEGGSISATTGMALDAGRDLTITTTTHSATSEAGDNTFSLQGIDRVAGLYVNGEAGDLIASAGGAINLTGAQLHNVGSGVTQLTAGDSINLDTVEIGQSHDINWRPNNYHRQSNSEEIGTVVSGGGGVSLNAGQDINLRAAQIDAQGALAVNAIGNINIEAGQRSDSLAEGFQTQSSGLLSSKTTTRRSSSVNTQALASELGGQTVAITSGQDIRLSGANVLSDQDLGIHAGGNLTIDAAQNTFSETHFQDTQKSGLFSSGIGFTIGSQQQQSDAQSTATFAAPSTVGSLGGNITLSAGDTYTQIGSDVLAPMGDITIAANTVNIQEARETSYSQTEQRFKQGGLSFSLSSPVVDTAQRLQGQINAAGDTQSSRMQALAAANSALAVTDIQQQLQGGQASDFNLNISLGSSESRSNSTSDSDTARGSSLIAGGNLAIHALGEGEGEGNIIVQGSQLDAGNQVLLNAAQDINLLASADTTSNRSSHSSSSTSAGIGIGASGINLNLDAHRAQGHGNGDSTTYNNTQLTAGNEITLNSGGDTTLQGAVVSAPQITANIGGNLTIESLQDTATQSERHSSSGGSLSVPIAGAGQFSASLNASRTNIDSDYQSVNEQSGFRAGDGGFQVNVEGIATLTGGAITSTDAAVNAGQNTFNTAGQNATEALESGAMTLSDIDNRALIFMLPA